MQFICTKTRILFFYMKVLFEHPIFMDLKKTIRKKFYLSGKRDLSQLNNDQTKVQSFVNKEPKCWRIFNLLFLD